MLSRLATSGIVMFAMIGLSLVTATSANATHNSTSCKWNFPWPRQVDYWIEQGTNPSIEFTAAEATRVSYGPATWSEGNFNLYFNRVSTVGQSEGGDTIIAKGSVSDPDAAAETTVYPPDICNLDLTNPIAFAVTIFNQSASFNLDCNANHATCVSAGQIDLHNTSSHETGHWFAMDDIHDAPNTATMW